MIYILLAVCCSVLVSVMFKLARRYQLDILQAITWNYSAALILTFLFLKPDFSQLPAAPVYTYSILGFLLPTLFIAIAASVRFSGIIRTDAAQRISLVLPLVAAYIYFGESLNLFKTAGVITGLIAVGLLLIKPPLRDKRIRKAVWIYPLIVFLGFGLVDILFKQVALIKQISFGTTLFAVYGIAFVLALLGFGYLIAVKKTKFRLSHIGLGWVLGVVNFGNILFYIKAHQALANSPSVVFSAMNIGVIALGTLVGAFVFKEKTSWLNRAGLLLAVAAIVFITLA